MFWFILMHIFSVLIDLVRIGRLSDQEKDLEILLFDTVFKSEKVKIIRTPYRAPNANAFAERWVRTGREECLDKLIIINQPHLAQVMREFTAYYNTARPHQGINQEIPDRRLEIVQDSEPIIRQDVLGGIIHDYQRAA